MMKNTYKRGFTLIELLVVIAIIGILASVVLASLNTARDKGADAAVKSDVGSIRAQAELLYDTSKTYAAICTDTSIVNAITHAKTSVAGTATIGGLGDGECVGNQTAYAVWVNLKGSDAYFCADSTGNAKVTATRISSATSALTACP